MTIVSMPSLIQARKPKTIWTIKGTMKSAQDEISTEYSLYSYTATFKRIAGRGNASIWRVEVIVNHPKH